jgi:hypothetical protein
MRSLMITGTLYLEHSAIVSLAILRNYLGDGDDIYLRWHTRGAHLAGVYVFFANLYDGNAASKSLHISWVDVEEQD